MHDADQDGHSGRHDQRPRHRYAAAELRLEPGRRPRGDEHAGRERDEREPGVQRREPEAPPRKNTTAMAIPAANPRWANMRSSTSGEPSRRVLIRSYPTKAARVGPD